MIIVSVMLWKQTRALTITGIALSLILGGAVGNLWDRIASGRVVDFLLFYVKQYQWPVFNLADSSIVVGAALLVIDILWGKPTPPRNSRTIEDVKRAGEGRPSPASSSVRRDRLLRRPPCWRHDHRRQAALSRKLLERRQIAPLQVLPAADQLPALPLQLLELLCSASVGAESAVPTSMARYASFASSCGG